ncbi:methylamine utilization protein [Alteromonas sp. KUL150]|uniref:methylamine utilization protein n=1 Tax=unclassified Alteromonas TaxID=2614992 RepID=UPI001330C21A|nr:methylamine utilization protein [Alteromonas sp. KUL150]
MKYKIIFSAVFLMACSSMALGQDEQTATFSITLNDSDGEPVDNGVFLFEPQFEPDAHQMPQQEPAVMNQIDKQFEPHVLVVKAGTEVTFPNADNLFHHVYSFSPTKQFELKLYKEFTAEPLRFENAGIVDIGCNIHDWMLGYIVVSDSPYFGKTDNEGESSISLPHGEYTVRFWHPQVEGEKAFPSQSISVTADTQVIWTLDTNIIRDDGFDSGFGDY